MTRTQLTGYLNCHNYRGLRGWCQERSYPYNTANAAVNRHLGREAAPRGKTLQILLDLEKITGKQLFVRRERGSGKEATVV